MSPYSLRPVAISQPLGFYGDDDFFLDGNTPLGDEAMDASSQPPSSPLPPTSCGGGAGLEA